MNSAGHAAGGRGRLAKLVALELSEHAAELGVEVFHSRSGQRPRVAELLRRDRRRLDRCRPRFFAYGSASLATRSSTTGPFASSVLEKSHAHSIV